MNVTSKWSNCTFQFSFIQYWSFTIYVFKYSFGWKYNHTFPIRRLFLAPRFIIRSTLSFHRYSIWQPYSWSIYQFILVEQTRTAKFGISIQYPWQYITSFSIKSTQLFSNSLSNNDFNSSIMKSILGNNYF